MPEPDIHSGLEFVLAHVIQDFMRFMHQTGLSRPQIHALLHVFHAGECPISEIAALTEASPAAASQLVERLVRQGLLQRTEDPRNRRIKNLRLTTKGLKLIHQGATSSHFLAELMSQLPPRQRQVVLTAFGYLAEAGRRIHPRSIRKVEQHAQTT
jgi:DNA-binding MarR family transcriptional regulator